jgi:UDP-GlcNAc:undecaprenyl-phosphate GlcNAc-1-phosphate transferase
MVDASETDSVSDSPRNRFHSDKSGRILVANLRDTKDGIMIVRWLVFFTIPMILSLILTPGVIRLAKAIGAIDSPNERKIHKEPTPRLGGVAIFLSVGLALLLLGLLSPELLHTSSETPFKVTLLGVSLALIVLLGTWDDVHTLTPAHKLLIQLLAGTLVYLAGFRISTITHPLSPGLLDLGMFDYPATLLWVVGITNAFNLIDGLDGLAAGVAVIASMTIFTIAAFEGNYGTAMIVLILAGGLVGFLHYNFNPARIFLGDSGSLFLGFFLAVMSIETSTKGSTTIAILVPILALGLPIIDTLLAMVRRVMRSVLSLEDPSSNGSIVRSFSSMFHADRQHIHHRLIEHGLSHRNVVLILYLVSCILGVGALAVTVVNNAAASMILICVAVGAVAGVRHLGYQEMALLRNGVFLPLSTRPIVNRKFFQMMLDFVFIIMAYCAAYYFGFRDSVSGDSWKAFLSMLGLAGGIQITSFYLLGLYRMSYQHLGIADALGIIKTIAASVIAMAVVIALVPETRALTNISVLVFDFYILLSLVIGSRVSYHVLHYFFRQEHCEGKRVLIYGGDQNGIMILDNILNNERLHLTPVGFLDDSPELEGKRLHGYPIFGGHWKLSRIVRQHAIDQIVLSRNTLTSEVFDRVKKSARELGIPLLVFRIGFEHVSLEQNPLIARPAPLEPLQGIQHVRVPARQQSTEQ